MTRLPRRLYEWPTASMNEGRGNTALGIMILLCLAHLRRCKRLWLQRILMGEVEVVQPLPVLRIERIVPHLLQQHIKLGSGADRCGFRMASRGTQIRDDDGSRARFPRVIRPVLRQANYPRADVACLFE